MTSNELKARLRALWAWALTHWLYVIAGCICLLLLVGSLGVFKTQETKQVAEEGAKNLLLTKKEVKAAKKIIAANTDSIRTQTIIIRQIVHVRDSAVVAARHHEAKADSLLKSLPDEDFTAPTTATIRVERFLTDYKPAAYQTTWLDSIR
jgi:Tfp pilus assembly protein PilN